MVHNSNQDKVLVTGVSGYVGAHVLLVLLKSGYWVRGTVRSQQKADQVKAKYPQYKDKLELVIVEDIAKAGAFEGALHGIDGVFHVASPFHFKPTNNKTDILDPAILGTTGILESALKVPTVKRIVVTSSFAANMDDSIAGTPYVVTEKDWSPLTYEDALNGNPRAAYLGSKKLAEKAVYDFVAEKKPHFDVVTLNPPLILGPIEHHISKLTDLNESAMQFYEFINGKKVDFTWLDVYVDVRDIALAHKLAYETPAASNQRYIITNKNYTWQEVVDIAHKFFPNQTKADVGQPGNYQQPNWHVDNSKSLKELQIVYTPKEDTFKDAIAQILQFQEQGL